MQISNLTHYRNPASLLNTTIFQARGIARRLRLGQYKWFGLKALCPAIPDAGVVLQSVEPLSEADTIDFIPEYFAQDGLLWEEALNHYIGFALGAQPYYVNAGYLMQFFIVSESLGYSKVREILDAAAAGTLATRSAYSEEEASEADDASAAIAFGSAPTPEAADRASHQSPPDAAPPDSDASGCR